MTEQGATGRVRIKDVAKAAGVSPATVSFVLNETPGQTISAPTRERVRAAALALGYRPHRIARALREGSSRVVVLDAGSLRGGTGLAGFVAGLGEELRRHDHTLLVTGQPGGLPEDVVDAVAPRAVLDLAGLLRGTTPADSALTDGPARHARTQVGYLASRGHVHLASALPVDGTTRLAALRLKHTQWAAADAGLPPVVPVEVGRDREGAAAAVRGLRSAHPEVTAVAAYDDDVALAVLAGMSVVGLRAPGDLAVIGFDDAELGALWSPSLTTIRIDGAAYGRQAARLVLGLEPGPLPDDASRVVARQSA